MISADGKVAGCLGHTDKPILQSRTADQRVKYGGHGMSTVSVLRDLVNRRLHLADNRIGTYLPESQRERVWYPDCGAELVAVSLVAHSQN